MDANMGFWLKKTVEAIFLSPVLPFLLVAFGLLTANRKVRRRLFYAWLGLFILIFFSTPLTVDWMAKKLENFPAVSAAQIKTAQAIVILGGGARGPAREYDGFIPNRLTLERLCYGARLAKESGLPVLVSGGAPRGMEPEARIMAKSLQTDLGITARWLESRSLDTEDNAVFSAGILKKAGIQKVVLVTTALHMRRSQAAFSHQGIEVVPAPVDFIADRTSKKMFFDNLPNATSAHQGWGIVHEWVGILVQKFRYGIGI